MEHYSERHGHTIPVESLGRSFVQLREQQRCKRTLLCNITTFQQQKPTRTSYLQRAIKINACVTVESAEATHRNKIRGVHEYADGLQSQHVEIGGGARVVRHGLQGLVFQRVHVLRCKVLGRECNAACAATHAPSTLHAAGRSSTAPRIFARSL